MNWTWVIAIEGLSFAAGLEVVPTGLSSIADPGISVRPGGVRGPLGAYVPLLVPGSVRLGETAVNVLSGDPPSQSLSFDLILGPSTVSGSSIAVGADELFELLFGAPQPIGQLGSIIEPDDTSFTVACPGGDLDALITQGVLYIGREAFVGTASSNTWTIASDVPSGPIYPVSLTARSSASEGEMGHLYTRITRHTTRVGAPPWQDDQVYLALPSLSGRRVFLYRGGFDADGEYIEQLFGQYVLNGDFTTNPAGTTVTLSALSLIGASTTASLNTRPVVYPIKVDEFESFRDGLYAVSLQGPADTSLSTYVQPAQISGTNGSGLVPMASGDAGWLLAVALSGNTATDFANGSNIPSGADGFIPQRQFGYAGGLPQQPGALVTANELLISDPTIHPVSGEHPFWDGLAVQQNPITMVLQHLGLHDSQLSSNWILDLGPDAVSIGEITTLRNLYGAITFPGVVAGGDGRPLPALKWLSDTYLRPIGCGWATDQHGRLTIRSLLAPLSAITAITQNNALSGRAQRRSLQVAADAVRITTGQGGGNAPKLTINGALAFRPEAGVYNAPVYEIDGRGFVSPEYPGGVEALLSSDNVGFARGYASSVGQFLRGGPLQALVRVTSSGVTAMDPDNLQDLLPGSLVRVTLVGMRGRDNKLLESLVLSHRWANDYTVQELRVLVYDVSFRRWSAAAVITGVTDNLDGTYTLTFDTDDTTQEQPYEVDGVTYATDLSTLVDQYGLGGVRVTIRDELLEVVESDVPFDGVDTVTAAAAPLVGQWLTLGQLGDNAGSAAQATLAFIGRDRWTI